MISDTDRKYLAWAVAESRKCAPSATAYSVGAVVVTRDGRTFAGYSRESAPHNHAEEEAIIKAEQAGADLRGATMYSSMEPCTHRRSKPLSCTGLIIARGFARVVYALPEPPHLACCDGCETLGQAGVEVVRIDDFDAEVEKINSHISDIA